MPPFVPYHSIVRRIWGDADVILLIFAGSAAEFALNKAVDWLFFTGKLPADPIGRLFSTVQYAQRIVFSSDEEARMAVGRMADIHAGVENQRKNRRVQFVVLWPCYPSFLTTLLCAVSGAMPT